jgi:uncharacterized membrane protein
VKKPRPNRPVQNQQPQQHIQVVSQDWSGPLPPPAALEEFDRIVPGAAERIFAQFEAEGTHRRDLEQRQSRFVVRDVHIGQFLAGLFALSGLSVAALAIWFNAPWVATIIGGGTIGPIVYAFLRKTAEEK